MGCRGCRCDPRLMLPSCARMHDLCMACRAVPCRGMQAIFSFYGSRHRDSPGLRVQAALDIARCSIVRVLETQPVTDGYRLGFVVFICGSFFLSVRGFCFVRLWPPSLFTEKVSES